MFAEPLTDERVVTETGSVEKHTSPLHLFHVNF
jgi:hypothetical protein